MGVDAAEPLGTDSRAPLSLSQAPASHTLELHAGPQRAGDLFLLLGSASGVAPTIPAPPIELALAIDDDFLFTLGNPNTLPLTGGLGVLDANGDATAQFELPAGANPALAGWSFWHAFVALDAAGLPDLASQSVNFTLLP